MTTPWTEFLGDLEKVVYAPAPVMVVFLAAHGISDLLVESLIENDFDGKATQLRRMIDVLELAAREVFTS
jgi:hypothetical protein